MNAVQKMVAELRCRHHAMEQALPELERAANIMAPGPDLVKQIEEVMDRYGL